MSEQTPEVEPVEAEDTQKPKLAKKAKPAQALSQTQRARAIALAKIEAAKR